MMKQTVFLLKSLVVMTLLAWPSMSHAQRYEVNRGSVYFGRQVVPQADARSFVDLGYGYAKDQNNVYLNGRVLEFVDPYSFRLKAGPSYDPRGYDGMGDYDGSHSGYYKTQFHVYFGNKKIDAMASTFVILADGYAKDAFNVFFYGKKLSGALAASFQVLEGGYAKDNFSVYYCGVKVEGAFASSFKYTGGGYGEDSFNVYFRGRKLE